MEDQSYDWPNQKVKHGEAWRSTQAPEAPEDPKAPGHNFWITLTLSLSTLAAGMSRSECTFWGLHLDESRVEPPKLLPLAPITKSRCRKKSINDAFEPTGLS